MKLKNSLLVLSLVTLALPCMVACSGTSNQNSNNTSDEETVLNLPEANPNLVLESGTTADGIYWTESNGFKCYYVKNFLKVDTNNLPSSAGDIVDQQKYHYTLSSPKSSIYCSEFYYSIRRWTKVDMSDEFYTIDFYMNMKIGGLSDEVYVDVIDSNSKHFTADWYLSSQRGLVIKDATKDCSHNIDWICLKNH